ncbi:hypothetical protein GW17_00055424 [Ensete ventricosum]|nr:hypothetical protein GW17_00055424 [Ensete ventricosum]RZS26465.1 hypothetical protein BHM03_00059809 [Ensete ventricosum]
MAKWPSTPIVDKGSHPRLGRLRPRSPARGQLDATRSSPKGLPLVEEAARRRPHVEAAARRRPPVGATVAHEHSHLQHGARRGNRL